MNHTRTYVSGGDLNTVVSMTDQMALRVRASCFCCCVFIYFIFPGCRRLGPWPPQDAVASEKKGPSLKVLVAGSVVARGGPRLQMSWGTQEVGGRCPGGVQTPRGLAGRVSRLAGRASASSVFRILLSLPARIIFNFVFCFQANSCRVSGRHGPASVTRKPRPCFLCVDTVQKSSGSRLRHSRFKAVLQAVRGQRASERSGRRGRCRDILAG